MSALTFGREWTIPSCGACMRIVERHHGYRPGDDVIGPLGRGVVDAIVHSEGQIQVVGTFDGFVVTIEPGCLTKDSDGASARTAATWALGRGR